MRSLRINGFKTDAPYNAVYFRLTNCKGSIGYFAGGPPEKFYRIFTAMMNIVAYDASVLTNIHKDSIRTALNSKL